MFSALALLLVTISPLDLLAAEQVRVGLNDVIDSVEQQFRIGNSGLPPLTTVTADFFQRSTIAAQNRELRADGQMFLKFATGSEPLMFRFDYFRPLTQEIICDGRSLWMYQPDNRRVILSDVRDTFDPDTRFNPERDRATNFLQGLGRISKDFDITFASGVGDVGGNYVLELTPRRVSVSIAKLLLVVHKDAVLRHAYSRQGRNDYAMNRPELEFPILSTTVIDPDGNTTTMEFSNIKTNVFLSDFFFKFMPPADVQVVRPPSGR
jgi:outer membrane lipoprotein-sorting protein